MMRYILISLIFQGFFIGQSSAKTVEYQFDIDYKMVNMTGKPVKAMAIDGAIPAPTIEATVGDTLKVTFHNKMDVMSSVHWHGILLPNVQDGVPYLTTPPIAAGGQHTFEFPVKHHGTYWYHSHTGLQEQRGVYGSIVFHPKDGERVKADYDQVVVLSDWTNTLPQRVLHNLKKSDDYYALKKDSVLSWQKAFQYGRPALLNRLHGAWQRMGPMDMSDVGYDAFLVNGQPTTTLSSLQGGETVRLRVINASASSYFHLQFAGGPMTIVAADGVDVEPVTVHRQRIAIAETYDVIVTLPDDKHAYEFRATSVDGTGFSSLILGQGRLVSAPEFDKPNVMLAGHHEHGSAMTMSTGHDSPAHQHAGHVMPEKTVVQQMEAYELLRALEPTSWQSDEPDRVVALQLTGNMERYTWSFNNRVLSEDSVIPIKQGERVQFELHNQTMMHHPIHLHGHFFRVLNGQGTASPLKHTVNVPPMQTVKIEFLANEQNSWFFHCHNLYHMKTGMSRAVHYEESPLDLAALTPMFHDQDWFYFADTTVQNNAFWGELRAENTYHAVNIDYEWDYEDRYEWGIAYEYVISRFLAGYIGFEQEKEKAGAEASRHDSTMIGFHYVLPLLLDLDARIDHRGHGRLALANEHQLTDRVAFEWEVNTDEEYRFQLGYEWSKQLVVTGGRDDTFDWGMGLTWRY